MRVARAPLSMPRGLARRQTGADTHGADAKTGSPRRSMRACSLPVRGLRGSKRERYLTVSVMFIAGCTVQAIL
jgi:hypothetical protein